MRIILDTEKRIIKEKWSREDKKKCRTQVEADQANILIVALVGAAAAHYKKTEVRKMYVKGLCDRALRIIDKMEDAE